MGKLPTEEGEGEKDEGFQMMKEKVVGGAVGEKPPLSLWGGGNLHPPLPLQRLENRPLAMYNNYIESLLK